MKNPKTLIKNTTILTLDKHNRVLVGDVIVADKQIAAIDPASSPQAERAFDQVIDGSGRVLLPGFVQTHIHLCQTLFRGAADDLALIDWLKQRIWPMEAAHTEESLYASARLGIAELLCGGTTCALTMETVHHTDAVFRAVAESGLRATVGKCMMDQGDEVPVALQEQTEQSLAASLALCEQWHGRDDGRIRYCFAPRFAISCTKELLERVAVLARERSVLVHTHASENLTEINLVERQTGKRNIAYLQSVGLTSPQVVLAHCVHLVEEEFDILRQTGVHIAHCPSSNLKLGSGIAPVNEMLERGISVSLGADGAPCNNQLDMFTEMRTAALLQKVRHGPQALPALTALRMATIQGARALGLEEEVGSIEVGKRADLLLLNLEQLHTTPHPDLISAIVYSASRKNVETVMIDGRVVVRDGLLLTMNEAEVMRQAGQHALALSARLSL